MAINVSLYTWRGLCVFLLIVVFLQFYLITTRNVGDSIPPRMPGFPPRLESPSAPKPLKKPDSKHWGYQVDRDSSNTGLSRQQCDLAFPDLYDEINRAVSMWQERRHHILPKDIEISWRDNGAFQALIHDNQLRVLQTKNTHQLEGYRKRTMYVLSQLHRALLGAVAAGESVPDVEFAVTVDDISLIPNPEMDTHTIWAFTRKLKDHDQDRLWLIPDFNFFAAPPIGSSYIDMQRRAKVHDALIVDKIPKAIWRGVRWTNEHVRGNLLDVTDGKDWADVKEVNWTTKADVMGMDDMCRYAFVVHTEGRSWSGRLKFLLNCNSLPVVHDLDWTSEFYHLLIPEGEHQNYIPVKKDFSDLEEKVKFFLENPPTAQRIADNAVATFRTRYTSLAAEACYWRQLIRGWSEVAFNPKPFEAVTVNVSGKAVEEKRLRGITFEEWLLLQGNFPADYQEKD